MLIKSRRVTWLGHVTYMDEMRTTYKILVTLPQGKKPLGRPVH